VSFSRAAPSARYRELIALYRRLHAEGEKRLGLAPDQTYPGVSLLPHLRRIKALIADTGARSVLDYGCGKAQLYDLADLDVPGLGRIASVVDYWDIDEVSCYDPCVPAFERLGEQPCDGVIATDVLEHCPEEDVPWIVAELFAHARKFVFASIACYAAKTHLPNGENAHCTIRPLAWWRNTFETAARERPGPIWKLYLDAPGAH
jgi:SAM-dependent methyltransferase